MAQWELAGTARNGFADMIEGLDAEQLNEQSWCSEWSARGVLAHVTGFVETGGFEMFTTMAKAGFKPDKAFGAMVDKRADRTAADLIGSLRTHASKSAPMPGFPEIMTVTDVAIHTQDVRRPLGLPGELDDSVLRASLDFIANHKRADTLVDRRSLDGVRLEATDLDWSHGTGDVISGTGEALLMAVANRPVLDDLDGPGIKHWTS